MYILSSRSVKMSKLTILLMSKSLLYKYEGIAIEHSVAFPIPHLVRVPVWSLRVTEGISFASPGLQKSHHANKQMTLLELSLARKKEDLRAETRRVEA